jgi:hypothetical protein
VEFLKSLLKPIVPAPLLLAYRQYGAERMNRRFGRMSAREVFTDIYEKNRWGGAPGTYCSGSGSATSAIVNPYVACVRRHLMQLGAHSLRAVDLGCGDFSVGRRLADDCASYIGVDIVESLIAHNEAAFGTDRITFQCLDIIADPLPAADICFLRQVLQHLSNDQIRIILPKLEQYSWVFVTEHQPSPGCLRVPNVDKTHGSDIRIRQSSGVFLEHPPFNLPPEKLRLILEVGAVPSNDGSDPGLIRTFLLLNRGSAAVPAEQ